MQVEGGVGREYILRRLLLCSRYQPERRFKDSVSNFYRSVQSSTSGPLLGCPRADIEFLQTQHITESPQRLRGSAIPNPIPKSSCSLFRVVICGCDGHAADGGDTGHSDNPTSVASTTSSCWPCFFPFLCWWACDVRVCLRRQNLYLVFFGIFPTLILVLIGSPH